MPSPRSDFMPPAASPRSTPPSTPSSSRPKKRSWARKVERCCCQTLAYFPLTFVYGLTTWAVYVAVQISFFGVGVGYSNLGIWPFAKAGLAVLLYGLANASYTTAVFTSPGTPLDERRDLSTSRGALRRDGGGGGRYDQLPTYEERGEGVSSVTAKSSGQPRYCKKCHSVKPDRTHHCSTCGRCVLKMDHHCPWLATCVGLRNYKPFLLFLGYTSLFCWVCFALSASWVWAEIMDETQIQEGVRVINTILLAVLGGIIGLVLSGFTGWHIYLAITGQTTIESLEKTRYLTPLRNSMAPNPERNYLPSGSGDQTFTEQLKQIHANALPGILRPEEGDTSLNSPSRSPAPGAGSPAQHRMQRSYASLEAQREHDRYAAYLEEKDSEKLPNAFNLGWKRNLTHVFGHEKLYWGLPVCNTSSDGWLWEVSPKWTEAREELARQREARERAKQGGRPGGEGFEGPRQLQANLRWMPGQGFVDHASTPPHVSAPYDQYVDTDRDMQLQPLDRRKQHQHGTAGSGAVGSSGTEEVDPSESNHSSSSSSDEDMKRMYNHVEIQGGVGTNIANWNDVPDEYLSPRRNKGGGGVVSGASNGSRGRRKGD